MFVDPSGSRAAEFVVGMLASGRLDAGPELRIRLFGLTDAMDEFSGSCPWLERPSG